MNNSVKGVLYAWRAVLAAAVLALAAPLAQADALGDLEAFLRSAKSGRAEFTQVVTAPPREGQPARSKTSSGSFEFQRPDRFRFQYSKPFEQVLVADGSTLWLHDVDLNQVTARAQARALASTPVALLAGAADLAALQRDFTLSNAPDADGRQWVDAQPKARDGSLRRVRIGFRNGALSALEIEDSFGQRSVLSFAALQIHLPIAPERLRFAPPAGADVVRQ
ncbi:MAG: outer membrane lipoprotein chaperone LolA [Burkholderiaceae bacterium]